MANVVLDPVSTYSFVYVRFASDFEMLCDVLDAPIHVCIPVGESIVVAHVYHAFPISFIGFQTLVDFHIILGIISCS